MVVAIVMMGTCLAGDAVQSGLKVGESVNSFNVDDITGRTREQLSVIGEGTERARWSASSPARPPNPWPVWSSRLTRRFANGKLKSFVVIVPKKGDSPSDDLKKLAQDASIKHVPLTIGESPDGPPDYELARDADITVLMWHGGTVKVTTPRGAHRPERPRHRGRYSQSPERLDASPLGEFPITITDPTDHPQRRACCPGRVIS